MPERDTGGEKKKRLNPAASERIDRINQQGLIRIHPKPLPVPGAG